MNEEQEQKMLDLIADLIKSATQQAGTIKNLMDAVKILKERIKRLEQKP